MKILSYKLNLSVNRPKNEQRHRYIVSKTYLHGCCSAVCDDFIFSASGACLSLRLYEKN